MDDLERERIAQMYPEGSPLRELARRGLVRPPKGGGPTIDEIRRLVLSSTAPEHGDA